ncbi:MAG: ABC transporter ATP-binding protein, partial [Chlorobiales bacterium]|nr:ABC transporter ATP-binding protein [Chlorobiales bacterium]
MPEALLEIQDLVTSFKTTSGLQRVLDGINLSLQRGEILGLVGESGCGKSITSLSIMRLLPQPYGFIENGKILFNDKELTDLSIPEMESIRGNEISMIFQEPMTALNPVFTVGNQIEEVLDIHQDLKKRDKKEKCIEMLKLVGLPRAEDIYKEYPHQLSGGMRQRVMIAMALSCEPRLLIADEPTTA